MCSKIVLLLILISLNENLGQTALQLPEGFSPQLPSKKPLSQPAFYPFNLASIYYSPTISSSDWRPIIPNTMSTTTDSQLRHPALETVIYGTQKSGRYKNHKYNQFTTQTPINNADFMENKQRKIDIDISTTTTYTDLTWPNMLLKENLTDDLTLEATKSLMQNIPVNITKVGVPYEDINSSDEASICVPLTVEEQLPTSDIIEVDRVYCFPLPPGEEDAVTELSINDTTTTTFAPTNISLANIHINNSDVNTNNIKLILLLSLISFIFSSQ